MATTFQYDCPHCQSKRSAFSIIDQYPHRSVKGRQFITSVCGVCDIPIIVQYVDMNIVRGYSATSLTSVAVDFPGINFVIETSWPTGGSDAPSDLPINVQKFFEQGSQNERAQNWDAAGAMFRKTLDVATKILDPALSAKNLFHRIEALVTQGSLTAAIGEWAHEIRIDGNDAVHGDEPETSDDVAAMHEFCRAFLTYSFSLPSLVARRKSRSSVDQQESTIQSRA